MEERTPDLPPRYSPDNRLETRAARVAQYENIAYDHALAWLELRAMRDVELKVEPEPEGEL